MFESIRDFFKITIESPVSSLIQKLKKRFFGTHVKLEPQIKSISLKYDWGIQKLNIPEAWKISQGEGIKIAILDTGVATMHPDLRDAIVEAVDFTTEHNPNDTFGHGTHCAGIATARSSSDGMNGVAPKSKLYVGKVLNSEGSGDFEWITQGVLWAINRKVHIISMSLGSNVPYERLHNAIIQAYNAGIIVVCAAGNDGEINNEDTIGYPARYDEVIAVGSLDENMQRSSYSSVGDELDIMAPGENICSTYPNNRYAILSGTSMATPLISGICALILSKHINQGGGPILNSKDMLEHLKKISMSIGSDGWNQEDGWGTIDPNKITSLSKD